MYPSDYLFTEEHEWVHVEEGVCALGITEYAQNELGEIVYVETPEVGDTIEGGDEIGTIESVKTVAELYTPVSGEIVEVNAALEDAPEMVNNDPHGDGWIVKIRFSSEDELQGLMNAQAYQEFVAAQEEE